MRKIYSLVLMAAALLIGTNIWADVHDVQTDLDEASISINGGTTRYATTIYDAFDAVGYDGTTHSNVATITLLKSIQITKSIVLYVPNGTTVPEGHIVAAKDIELNMNGCEISTKFNYWNNTNTNTVDAGSHTPIILLQGKLNITGTGQIKNTCTGWHMSAGWPTWVSAGIAVCGSPNEKDFDFSVLKVGSGVTITSEHYAGISFYTTGGTSGFTDRITSATTGYFGIKNPTELGYDNYSSWTKPDGSSVTGTGWGINVEISGTVVGDIYGIYFTGRIGAFPSTDPKVDKAAYVAELNSRAYPRIHVKPGALIRSDCGKTSGHTESGCNDKTKMGVYSSGWGIWTFEGSAQGCVGLFMKGGDVTLNNANVWSCWTGEHETTIATPGQAGGTGAGSAIIINSSAGGYAGNMSMTVEGDTKVTGASGCAIEETVTKTDNEGNKVSDVNVVTVESGTFSNTGTAPAISTTAETTAQDKIIVSGGNWNDNSPVTQSLVGSDGFATTTTDEEGHTVYVIGNTGEGGSAASSIDWHTDGDINTLTANDYLELTTVNNILTENRAIKYLKMAAGTSVTIPSGYSLTVEEAVLDWSTGADPSDDSDNTYATITVQPGGKLILTGNKGIVAYKPENIVLKANATQKATFVISPDVSSNKQPKATVDFTPNTYMKPDGTKVWQRFTSPLDSVTKAPTNNAADLAPISYVTGSSLLTYASYYDGASGWVNLTSWRQLRAFRASAIANNTPYGKNITYTFKGKLAGNVTDSIAFWNAGWNYYGNTYIAPMSTKSLLAALATARSNGIDVDGTLQMWNVNNQKYEPLNTTSGLFGGMVVEIPALHCFVIKLRNGNSADFDINYRNTVYDYAIHPENYSFSAPARLNSGTSTVRINIEAANGMKDAVCIAENNSFTSDYDDSADAEKLMDDGLNLYVADENNNLSILASDNILGSLLTLQTTDEFEYTLSFDYVRGEVYALRDNMTNAVVLMNEGAIYNFTAQPNATLEGRFQIVSRQEMPTAVETVEETINAPKAIYTVMGQYVGETTDWNNLPNGVYVIDGVKVIK